MFLTATQLDFLSIFAGLRLVHHVSLEHDYTFAIEPNGMYMGLLHVNHANDQPGTLHLDLRDMHDYSTLKDIMRSMCHALDIKQYVFLNYDYWGNRDYFAMCLPFMIIILNKNFLIMTPK